MVTIGYAVVLNRRLSGLRRDKDSIDNLAGSFGSATRRAEKSIGRLKSTTDGLQEQIKQAQSLRDDLVFLIDRGGSAADRLEDQVRTARDEGAAPKKAFQNNGNRSNVEHVAAHRKAPKVRPAQAPHQEADPQADQELMRALRAAR